MRGCAGLAPWHVVCNFTSESDVGGPLDVYVGVSDGSQKSGSLLFKASACSRSICRSAASSASRVSVSTALVSKSNFRFVPRAASLTQYVAEQLSLCGETHLPRSLLDRRTSR